MKVLSLWQPWASFMWANMKRYETRSWCSGYRGDVLICAAKHRFKDSQLLALPAVCSWLRYFCEKHMGARGAVETYRSLPFGKALCVVNLEDCEPTTSSPARITWMEQDLGDYSPGRWAWRTGNLRPLRTPFDYKGGQGLRTLDAKIEEQVLRELGAAK